MSCLDLARGGYRQFHLADEFHHSLAVADDGRRAAVVLAQSSWLLILDAATETVAAYDIPADVAGEAVISPLAKYCPCRVGIRTNILSRVDLATGAMLRIRSAGADRPMAWSRDDRYVATTNLVGNEVVIFDLETGERVADSSGHDMPNRGFFEPYDTPLGVSFAATRLVTAAGAGGHALYLCYGAPIYRVALAWR